MLRFTESIVFFGKGTANLISVETGSARQVENTSHCLIQLALKLLACSSFLRSRNILDTQSRTWGKVTVMQEAI